jgi:hypothetical protein
MSPPDPPDDKDPTPGSILRELVFNQYQAIVLGGAAVASLIAANPLPLLVWLGSELVLLPILDSGPLRRMVAKRRLEIARARANAERLRATSSLSPVYTRRYEVTQRLCGLIASNYQSLTGISQAYLSEQRQKLDVILHGYLHRLTALQRYERMPASRNPDDIQDEIAELERELEQVDLPDRARAALEKNLELKRRLLTSVSQVGDTVKTLLTELDSMESLLEVLHQNSMALRDPQAISEELDTIVRQSEESERVVREMEALLRNDATGSIAEFTPDATLEPANGSDRGGRPRGKVNTR